MKVVLITAQNNDFDKTLASAFVREDYKVYVMGNALLDGVTVIPGITIIPMDIMEAVSAVQKDSGFIDIYIDATNESSLSDNFNVRTGINESVIRDLYDSNVTRPMAMLEAFLPMLEAGEGKRLCYLTSALASINETQGADGFGYKTAKAALHNFLQITRNVLAPKGFSIRAFDPCLEGNCSVGREVSAPLSAQAAFNYFTRRRGIERDDSNRDDEGNLVFRDAWGRQHSW
jgi:NAD(P)-dependent dehydrogenase (short-subunit alcohol dehydrogenase family)